MCMQSCFQSCHLCSQCVFQFQSRNLCSLSDIILSSVIKCNFRYVIRHIFTSVINLTKNTFSQYKISRSLIAQDVEQTKREGTRNS